jgi:hypothetical protein
MDDTIDGWGLWTKEVLPPWLAPQDSVFDVNLLDGMSHCLMTNSRSFLFHEGVFSNPIPNSQAASRLSLTSLHTFLTITHCPRFGV